MNWCLEKYADLERAFSTSSFTLEQAREALDSKRALETELCVFLLGEAGLLTCRKGR